MQNKLSKGANRRMMIEQVKYEAAEAAHNKKAAWKALREMRKIEKQDKTFQSLIAK